MHVPCVEADVEEAGGKDDESDKEAPVAPDEMDEVY